MYFAESKNVRAILEKKPINGDYIETSRIVTLLSALEIILKNNIIGDIVQLGCESREISKYIIMMLDYYTTKNNNRDYHIYDGWENIAALNINDILDKNNNISDLVIKSGIKLSSFIDMYEKENIQCPIIHSGSLNTITSYPKKVAFVYLNTDMYENIITYNNIYNKISLGGCIVINNYPNKIGCNNVIKHLCINTVLQVNQHVIIIKNIEQIHKTHGMATIFDTITALYTKELVLNTYVILYGNNNNYRMVNHLLNFNQFKTFNEAFGDHLYYTPKKLIINLNDENNHILSLEIKENGKIKFTHIHPSYTQYTDLVYNDKIVQPYITNNYLNQNDLFGSFTQDDSSFKINLKSRMIELDGKGKIRII